VEDWLTIIAGSLGALVAAMAIFSRTEKTRRKAAEKRADLFERQAEVARETAVVLHQVAIERDEQLRAVEHDAKMQRERVEEASKELSSAKGDPKGIAGLWNKTFDGKE